MSKLEKKGVVRRYRITGNEKGVFIELTEKGKEIFEHHKKVNQETINQIHDEISDQNPEKIEFFLSMLNWTENYLAKSGKMMGSHK